MRPLALLSMGSSLCQVMPTASSSLYAGAATIVPGACTNTEASLSANRNSWAEMSTVTQVLHFLVACWRGGPYPDRKSTVHPAADFRLRPAASKHVLCPALGALGACAAAHPSDSRFQPVPRATAAAGLHATHASYNRWRA